MALLVFDGFEVAPFLRNTITCSAGTPVAGAGRTGGKAIATTNAGGGLTIPLPTTSAAVCVVGFAWYFTTSSLGVTNSRGHNPAFFGDGGATSHACLTLAADGKLQLRIGLTSGVVVASSVGSLTTATWHYVEMKTTVADAGGIVVVKVDGVEVINYTGDTKNGGTLTGVSTVNLPASSNGCLVDDFYCLDGTGAAPYNDFLGDRVVKAARPDGAGAVTLLTPSAGSNYQCVDEDPWTTADYVSAGVAASDTYSHADVSGFSSVDALQVVTYSLKTDAGVRTLRTLMRSALGTIAESADLALPTTVGVVQGPIRQTDPDAAPLTQTLVNSAQYGVKVV